MPLDPHRPRITLPAVWTAHCPRHHYDYYKGDNKCPVCVEETKARMAYQAYLERTGQIVILAPADEEEET